MGLAGRATAAGHLRIALIATLVAGCGGVVGDELLPPRTHLVAADAVVVLGDAADSELERRAERATLIWRRGLAPLVLSSDSVARRARALGVPASAISVQASTHDAAENARASIEALCQGRRPCAPDVIVVGSPYEILRARRLFECAGARVQIAPADGPEDYDSQVSSTANEYGTRLGYLFDDACARAAPQDSAQPR